MVVPSYQHVSKLAVGTTYALHTTARMMVKSSHQNEWTIQTRVTMRRKSARSTKTRNAIVRPKIAGPQLPSSTVAMIGVTLACAGKAFVEGSRHRKSVTDGYLSP